MVSSNRRVCANQRPNKAAPAGSLVSSRRRKYAGNGEPGGNARANVSATDVQLSPVIASTRSRSSIANNESKACPAYSSTAARSPSLLPK